MNSRATTLYIKSLAVLFVVFAHYTTYFEPESALSSLWREANGIIAVFFVLSGYGIFKSLARQFDEGAPAREIITRFYVGRLVRIYPLYWLALLITEGFRSDYDQLRVISLKTVGIYLGAPFIEAPGLFWFVTAIIQCYLLAPLLYLAWRRISVQSALLINVTLGALVLVLTYAYIFYETNNPFGWPARADLAAYMYRNIFLANVVLFSLGMLIGPLVSAYGKKLSSYPALIGSLALFLAGVYYTGDISMIFYRSETMMGLPLLVGAFSFCLLMVANDPPLPLKRYVAWLGDYSASIYLFHMFFLWLVVRVAVSTGNFLPASAYALMMLPLYLTACVALETLLNRVRQRSKLGTYFPRAPALAKRS